jgi:hypothetical protein
MIRISGLPVILVWLNDGRLLVPDLVSLLWRHRASSPQLALLHPSMISSISDLFYIVIYNTSVGCYGHWLCADGSEALGTRGSIS